MKLPEELLQISFALGVVDQVDRHLRGVEQESFVAQLRVRSYYINSGKGAGNPSNKGKIMQK